MFSYFFMPKLRTYCISHKFLRQLDSLGLKIIGSGAYKKKYPIHWLNDYKGTKNISKKNRSYGTLTSIYWIWKNDINDLGPNDYIGICHYRRFWLKEKHEKKINFNNLNKNLLKTIPRKYLKYDSFVCRPQNVSGYKFMKLIKKAKKDLINDPTILYNKKKHTINLHFNMFHIYNGLIDASNFLDKKDKKKFLNYINSKNNFFPLSIFIMKKKFFEKLCFDTFIWLSECEKIFDVKNEKSYGKIRIFDFLAERFFSYWISKYCKYKILPFTLIDYKTR